MGLDKFEMTVNDLVTYSKSLIQGVDNGKLVEIRKDLDKIIDDLHWFMSSVGRYQGQLFDDLDCALDGNNDVGEIYAKYEELDIDLDKEFQDLIKSLKDIRKKI
jgi:hypothetical protein